ncbi:MAG: hypothetical protein QOJ81_667 [Chloroflexota bacterium]|nr:hypothetical protein [Chloroflexota bacterium]
MCALERPIDGDCDDHEQEQADQPVGSQHQAEQTNAPMAATRLIRHCAESFAITRLSG